MSIANRYRPVDAKPEPKAAAPRPGTPRSGKELISIRLDADVLAAYRSLGKGWQGILNGDLRKIRGI